MPVLIERKKMTKATYQALKRHIMRERMKRKQEQEADLALERQKKEAERRKRLENENKNSLQQIKDEIVRLKKLLEDHKKEKSQLFAQLRGLLVAESNKKENEKKNDTHSYPMAQTGPNPVGQFLSGTGHMGRPVLYKPMSSSFPPQVTAAVHDAASASTVTTPAKRQRSQSPVPKQNPLPNMFQYTEFSPKLYPNQNPNQVISGKPSLQSASQASPMFGPSMPKYAPTGQAGFQPFLQAPHTTQAPPQLTSSKHVSGAQDSFQGRALGQRLPQTTPMSDDKAHRSPAISPSIRHTNPPKGSIMTGYPVHTSPHSQAPVPPMPLNITGALSHNLPVRSQYQRDNRYFQH